MTIYFLRHGESYANTSGVFAGQGEDSELTELGIEQAKKAGADLADKNIKRIISSKLRRASKTAEEAAIILGITEIEYDDRLLEYDMGELTGQPHHKITSSELV